MRINITNASFFNAAFGDKHVDGGEWLRSHELSSANWSTHQRSVGKWRLVYVRSHTDANGAAERGSKRKNWLNIFASFINVRINEHKKTLFYKYVKLCSIV